MITFLFVYNSSLGLPLFNHKKDGGKDKNSEIFYYEGFCMVVYFLFFGSYKSY